jgi:hypothetical protein
MAQKFSSRVNVLAATCLLAAAASAQTFTGVLTQHNDNARTGQNLSETILNQSNVFPWQFGKVFSYAVDGQIYAQPLYVPNLTIKGGVHNVVFVATEYNSVYAFDADATTNSSSNTYWHRTFLNVAKGIVPVPCGAQTAAGGNGTEISCNVFPFYGITGTPVIDPATNTMYLVVRTAETTAGVTTYYQRLHAISILTGADKSGSPVVISGSVPGTGAGSVGGIVTFDPLADIQRVGMTLANGTLYTAFAGAAHGWIMAYDEKTLKQNAIFNTAPNAVLGGIWQTGNGFVVDHDGNIVVSVGDAAFDVNVGGVDYGDAVLKLNPSTLAVEDYFTPMDQACRQGNDLDVGSAGPVILPAQTGTYPNEMLVIGKSGTGVSACPDTTDVYLINQDNLGKYETGQNNSDNVIQELTDPPGNTYPAQGFWSSPAFWLGEMAGTSYVYMAGTSSNNNGNGGAPLDQYTVTENNGVTNLTLFETSSNLFPQGSTPSVSSNGSQSGTGVVWAIERVDSLDQQPGSGAATLFAYNATNVTYPLYQSNAGSNGMRDQTGCANKFQTPTIANGRVFVGTMTQLDIFGELASNPPAAPGVYLSAVCNTFNNVQIGQKSPPFVVTITNSGNANLTFTSVTVTGVNASDFSKSLSNKCAGKTLTPGQTCTVSVVFAPTSAAGETAFITISDNAVGSPHNVGLYGQADVPTVNIVPSYVSFGQQDINIVSPSQAVTVSNNGNLVVTVSSVTITGTNASLFKQTNNCTSIPVNGNCTINVTFEPTATGQFTANLNVTDNATGSPQVVTLTGVGVQPNAVITSPNPPQINFGMVKVGTSSASSPVSLLNNGGGSLIISSMTFTGPNPGDFSETDNCNGLVPSGGTCTINVTFKPTAVGTRQAYLNINDNSDPSPQQVSLSGDGT